MEPQRLELPGEGGIPMGHVELIPAGPADGQIKIVIQLRKGLHILALRSDMCAGRISGILGHSGAVPEAEQPPAP